MSWGKDFPAVGASLFLLIYAQFLDIEKYKVLFQMAFGVFRSLPGLTQPKPWKSAPGATQSNFRELCEGSTSLYKPTHSFTFPKWIWLCFIHWKYRFLLFAFLSLWRQWLWWSVTKIRPSSHRVAGRGAFSASPAHPSTWSPCQLLSPLSPLEPNCWEAANRAKGKGLLFPIVPRMEGVWVERWC